MLTCFGLGIAAVILALAASVTDVYAQGTTELINYDNGTRVLIIHEKTETVLSMENVLIIIGSIGAAIVTAIFTPIIHERYKIREEYLVQYSKWCISFSGTLHEFRELCEAIKNPKKYGPVTNTDMIVHVWAMHNEIEKGYKWLNVVKQDNPTVGDILDELMDKVDELWHDLQDRHAELLDKQATSDDLYCILRQIKCKEEDKESILAGTAKLIKDVLEEKELPYSKKVLFTKTNFEAISKMLTKKIPWNYGFLEKCVRLTSRHIKAWKNGKEKNQSHETDHQTEDLQS